MENRVLKEKIRKSWDEHPCYPGKAIKAKEGTKEFFEELERFRYTDHAYLLDVVGFEKYADKKVLEIGCGLGTDLSRFANHGAIITGIDLSPTSIKLAKKRFKLFGLKGDLRVGDTENLSFPDNQFDLVYSMGVLHHTPDTQKAINEFYRVLKPGGQTIVMLYNKNFFTYYVKLVLLRWILSGKFLFMSFQRVRNDLEFKGCPLAKLFSKGEAKRLFRKFKQVEMQTFYIQKANVPLVGKLIPQKLLDILARRFGFHLIIKARK